MKEWPSVRDGGFGPDELHLLDMVFAGAWQHIKGRYHDGDAAAARERLASIVIALGKFKDADAEVLKAAALKAFDQLDSSPR